MRRREFLVALATPALTAPALVGLTRKAPPPLAGGFMDDAGARAHRLLREGSLPNQGARATERRPIVIIGGGIAGLSAAWELLRRGHRDFAVLELDPQVGGNARWGANDVSAFPWAAHYVPLPDDRTGLLRDLFEDLGVLRDGVWEERYQCFSPQERLFLHGAWRDSILPEFAQDQRDRDAFTRFGDLVAEHRSTGRYAVPMANGARADPRLDGEPMDAWLRRHQLDAPTLRWYVNYCCRDDYGATARDVSAWAGLHYFAARPADDAPPLTWPEGNGWIARRLAQRCASQLRTGEPALSIERAGRRWLVRTPAAALACESVIFAAPLFTLPFMLRDARLPPVRLEYSPWLTANLVLDRWPRERGRGVPWAWDNVIFDSPSLGYVIATHQSLATHHERSVWTYYWALAQHAPVDARRVLQQRLWREWADAILADLTRVHPDIRSCVSRVDILRMGHAMLRPVPGTQAALRTLLATAPDGLHLASSDVSGLPLFEEAHYRGVTAARAALARVGRG